MSLNLPDRLRLPLAALAGCVIAIAVMFAYIQLDPQEGRYNDGDIRRLANEAIASVTPSPPLEPQVYAMIRPAVVLLSHGATGTNGQAVRDIGSGVVVDLNGSILTAYHVVAGSDTVNVRFYDGTTATGTVVQKQPERDLAVVQVRQPAAGRAAGGRSPAA